MTVFGLIRSKSCVFGVLFPSQRLLAAPPCLQAPSHNLWRCSSTASQLFVQDSGSSEGLLLRLEGCHYSLLHVLELTVGVPLFLTSSLGRIPFFNFSSCSTAPLCCLECLYRVVDFVEPILAYSSCLARVVLVSDGEYLIVCALHHCGIGPPSCVETHPTLAASTFRSTEGHRELVTTCLSSLTSSATSLAVALVTVLSYPRLCILDGGRVEALIILLATNVFRIASTSCSVNPVTDGKGRGGGCVCLILVVIMQLGVLH